MNRIDRGYYRFQEKFDKGEMGDMDIVLKQLDDAINHAYSVADQTHYKDIATLSRMIGDMTTLLDPFDPDSYYNYD